MSSSKPSPPASLFEALERETERICRPPELEIALKSLLQFDPVHVLEAPVLDTRSLLKLTFSKKSQWRQPDGRSGDDEFPAALATVLTHSFRLKNLPSLKRKLWKRFLVPFPIEYTLKTDDWL